MNWTMIDPILENAIREDLGAGDVTTAGIGLKDRSAGAGSSQKRTGLSVGWKSHSGCSCTSIGCAAKSRRSKWRS